MTRRIQRPKRIYYTDGSCHPNPGPGGWAVVLNCELVASGHERQSSNQRMELVAFTVALRLAGAAPGRTEIRSDSMYALDVPKHGGTWQKNGWARKSGPLKNLDLIKPLYEAYLRAGDVTLTHVRGHQGILGNEIVDKYAALARLEGLR